MIVLKSYSGAKLLLFFYKQHTPIRHLVNPYNASCVLYIEQLRSVDNVLVVGNVYSKLKLCKRRVVSFTCNGGKSP